MPFDMINLGLDLTLYCMSLSVQVLVPYKMCEIGQCKCML